MRNVANILMVLFFVVFGVGCAQESHAAVEPVGCAGHFAVDFSKFSDVETEAILRARDIWNEFVGYELVKFSDAYACKLQEGSIPEESFDGVWDNGTMSITMDSSKFEPVKDDVVIFSDVVIHEIGHSLGFHHQADGMMAETATGEWSQGDREQCVELGWCD